MYSTPSTSFVTIAIMHKAKTLPTSSRYETLPEDFDLSGDPTLVKATASPGEGLSRSDEVAVVEITILAVLLFVTLTSNAFVMFSLVRSSMIRPMSRTYYFMFHISVADFLVGICNILPQLAWDITYRFKGPNWLCKIIKCVQIMPLYLSSLLLMFMAVDRYRAISWRRGASVWTSKRVAKTLVISAWATAFVLSLPQLFIFSQQELSPGVFDCWASFPSDWALKIYVVYFVMVNFGVPLLVITWSYAWITCKIWQYWRYRQGYESLRALVVTKVCCLTGDRDHRGLDLTAETSESSVSTVRVARVALKVHSMPGVPQPLSLAKVKTLKLTVVVMSAFIACHTPYCVTQLYHAFAPPGTTTNHPLSVILMLLPSLNSCTNPWIYLFFSESLLNQLKVCFGRGTNRPRHNASVGDKEPEDFKFHRNHQHYQEAIKLNACQGFASTKSDVVD
ncbi:isotocin receptor-like [Oratosquilla oratoria]|uniref:isotocin receptor-like n=1 Tax=Oratosquilla oratoria TaxID=337810 RepID=UPI003F767115